MSIFKVSSLTAFQTGVPRDRILTDQVGQVGLFGSNSLGTAGCHIAKGCLCIVVVLVIDVVVVAHSR